MRTLEQNRTRLGKTSFACLLHSLIFFKNIARPTKTFVNFEIYILISTRVQQNIFSYASNSDYNSDIFRRKTSFAWFLFTASERDWETSCSEVHIGIHFSPAGE